MEEADGIALEALALRLVAFNVWQAGDATPLEASMQCRSVTLVRGAEGGNGLAAAMAELDALLAVMDQLLAQ